MSKEKILLNSSTSMVQMFLTACLVFFQYKYLYDTIGISNLGIWSLVISVNSFFGVSGFGMQGSIIKFVSKYYSQGFFKKTVDVIETAFVTMVILSIAGLIIAYPLTVYILKFCVDSASYSIIREILPIAFISFAISMVGSISASALDGLNKIYLRNGIMFLVSVMIFIAVIIVTPTWGVYGLTCIKLGESITVLILSLVMLKRDLKQLPIIPRHWSREVFNEIIGYSLKFQVINFSVIFTEPLIKFFLSKFGGVAYVGMFELASKFVVQTRSFIVAAYQSLVPAVASYQEKEPEKIITFYISSYKFLFFICIPVFTLLVLSSPVISSIWIGALNSRFLFLFLTLAAAWFFNSIAVSAYFTNMGTGDIGDNVIAHILVAVLNIALGAILGYAFGGKGVAIASMFSIMAGGLYQLICFHRKNRITREIFPVEIKEMFLVGLVFVSIQLLLIARSTGNTHFMLYTAINITICIAAIILVSLRNRIFRDLIGAVSKKIPALKVLAR